ncbi:MAG TPA: hypothetical protein ENJ16_04075, partial [Planctomycetaceae bacterium]|nr:hypothetical protein [Planctomycetaceae bacterium]
MTSDYEAIRRENERKYGTDIVRLGDMLLSHRYGERFHFIFELLQNAEDALRRRPADWRKRTMSFELRGDHLRVEHYGAPFDEADVRGICGIGESTKDLTAIGQFGIGFKSVYAVTRRPEIYSGAEAFAIEDYVKPIGVSAIDRDPDATVFLFPFGTSDSETRQDLIEGLGLLDPSVLMFLRQIEEVRWSVGDGASGFYMRQFEELGADVRRVAVIGQAPEQQELSEDWLIFSRAVSANEGEQIGYVELAFRLSDDENASPHRLMPVERSPLVVFFPTVVETHLGFLVQGPYRTTPSRDNVPGDDSWNRRLVKETAALLEEALFWLRDNGLLDTAALRCLPLEPAKFGQRSMFAPLYEVTKSALSTQALLPRADAGHVPAPRARLGRSRELRDLFTPAQLAAVYGQAEELAWLSGDITADRTPELHSYLRKGLNVPELTPEDVVSKLDRRFLEAQSDDWIVRLYEFLEGQPALHRRLPFRSVPLIRLEDGRHVPPFQDGQPQAFLPGPVKTGFPTVKASVCSTDAARQFLQSLGIEEPSIVDDVILNVLPKYHSDDTAIDDQEYADDITRILRAFSTDSQKQREKLSEKLRDSAFVMAMDAMSGSKCSARPGDVYLATERLTALLAGVDGVLFVDTSYACLRGEEIRGLLEACGATRYLCPIPTRCDLAEEQLIEVRRKAGLERATWGDRTIKDRSLRGLDALLRLLPQLQPEERRRRARL